MCDPSNSDTLETGLLVGGISGFFFPVLGFLLFIWLLLLARLHHHYQYANKPRAAAAAAANDNWPPLISTNRICVGSCYWSPAFLYGMLAILFIRFFSVFQLFRMLFAILLSLCSRLLS